MKKLLLCSLALVMIVLAIAGCGKSTSSSSATTKELTLMVKPTLYQKILNASLFFQTLYYPCYMLLMARLSPVLAQPIN